MRQHVREFAKSEIAPVASELDRNPKFPWETLQKMGELGLLGVTTPEEYGGTGLSTLGYVVLLEEISAADAAHGTIMSVTNGLPQGMILTYGSDKQKEKYLPKLASGEWIGSFCLSEPHSGSDAVAMTTRATKVEGGYELTGTKAWTTSGGEAQVYLVMAKTDPNAGARGVSCFIVEKGTDGMTFGKPGGEVGAARRDYHLSDVRRLLRTRVPAARGRGAGLCLCAGVLGRGARRHRGAGGGDCAGGA